MNQTSESGMVGVRNNKNDEWRLPNELRGLEKCVGGVRVVVRAARLGYDGVPVGDVYVSLPMTAERPEITVGVRERPLFCNGVVYGSVNREIERRGYQRENGILRGALDAALGPYEEFVAARDGPGFKKYEW